MLNAHQLAALDREPQNIATMRAIHYAITSGAGHMSPAAQEALEGIAARIGPILVGADNGHGRALHWRIIAAVALQMEARALGIDHSLGMNDKTLTPD